ncbi:hypothetical protein K493DRAFT_18631 [Basidiobolus meristosporus CBS 931.73]|uniref:Uncharacterized protein n=1 Tax=Basidiobolus meristosporus CBS 931.73 TaxID=1314790 RepID=A0A1Y1Z8M8_9FUNG|nr:hypothetical protein K493DRAFT_18631 [Basidiobolus meristosporus CBS 931.73]|eukprot:ORY06618.1 hypothetical protein K493DRAFT_18631 [Basidiobolus meristosporus CBS 931.73]
MANQTLASASSQGGMNFGQSAAGMGDPGQASPHTSGPMAMQTGYNSKYFQHTIRGRWDDEDEG